MGWFGRKSAAAVIPPEAAPGGVRSSAAGEPRFRVRLAEDDAVLGKHAGRYLVTRQDGEGSRYWWVRPPTGAPR